MEHHVLYHTELWGYNRTWILVASKLFDKILIYYLLPVALPYCVTKLVESWQNMLPVGNPAAFPESFHNFKKVSGKKKPFVCVLQKFIVFSMTMG